MGLEWNLRARTEKAGKGLPAYLVIAQVIPALFGIVLVLTIHSDILVFTLKILGLVGIIIRTF